MLMITLYLKFTCPSDQEEYHESNILDRMVMALVISTLSLAGIAESEIKAYRFFKERLLN
jgi:hypothetical protein